MLEDEEYKVGKEPLLEEFIYRILLRAKKTGDYSNVYRIWPVLLQEIERFSPSQRERFLRILKEHSEFWPELLQWEHKELPLSLFDFEPELESFNQVTKYLRSRLDRCDKLIHLLRRENAHVKANIRRLADSLSSLQKEAHLSLVPDSVGIKPGIFPLYRILPLRVFLSEGSNEVREHVIQALELFSETLGFSFADEFPAEEGSWFKGWFTRSKNVLSNQEVTSRLTKGERAIELAVLHKKQAEVDKDQAEAAGTLLKALEKTPNAVCQIGSILVLKQTGGDGSKVFTRTMTPLEMTYLEKNQHLLKTPDSILTALQQANEQHKSQLPADEES